MRGTQLAPRPRMPSPLRMHMRSFRLVIKQVQSGTIIGCRARAAVDVLLLPVHAYACHRLYMYMYIIMIQTQHMPSRSTMHRGCCPLAARHRYPGHACFRRLSMSVSLVFHIVFVIMQNTDSMRSVSLQHDMITASTQLLLFHRLHRGGLECGLHQIQHL